MTNLQKKIATITATAALLVNTALPVLAGTTIEISGNGTYSDNDATVSLGQSTTVVQSNFSDVYNRVDADADTGDNDANDNTGGEVSVETGDASVDVRVSNALNSNTAEVDCCPSGDVDVLISGNGSNSDNTVGLKMGSSTELYQENVADVTNKVYADADTGGNDAEDNTGGSVSVETGNASVKVDLATTANSNSAKVGGEGEGGSLSAWITGNGTYSDNDIDLELGSLVLLAQSNFADVYNKVDADADTGDNDADDNTGGDVSVETGDAEVDVEVDNLVNFNWADLECGCLLDDLWVKIGGNGSDSDNTIGAELGQETLAFQGNCAEDGPEGLTDNHKEDCELENKLELDADSGKNDAEDNTGEPDGDPGIVTGDADASADIENSGNVNVLGDASFDLPEFDFDFDFGLNWLLIWGWLSGTSS